MRLRRRLLTDRPAVSMGRIDAVIGEAVSRVASTDPDPTDPFRGLYLSDAAAAQTAHELDGANLDAWLQRTATLLGLDPLDGSLLGLCAAPVLDARYGRLIGYLHDDFTRRLSSPRLLCRLLAGQATERHILSRLSCDARLRRCGAIHMLDDADGVPAVDRLLALDEQLATFLLGAELGREHLLDEVIEVRPDAIPARDRETLQMVARTIGAAGDLPTLVAGSDAEQIAAQALGCTLLMLPASRLHDTRLLAKTRLRATLTGARIAIHGLQDLVGEQERTQLRRDLAALGDGSLLCASRPRAPLALAGLPHLTALITTPSHAERARLWEAHIAEAEHGEVASAFAFSAQQIAGAARLALAHARSGGRERPAEADLRAAARRIARSRLGSTRPCSAAPAPGRISCLPRRR
jgi:hypothetical protein